MITNRAIVSTSANPFHFGHLDLYNQARKIFGKNNVKVAIGKNIKKDIDFNRIIFHMAPYNINYDTAEGVTLSDYCSKNKINYIIRGIRDSTDMNYELKLNSINKEINKNVKTIFLPTQEKLRNISSYSILELMRYGKFDVIKKFMNEDSMYRFFNLQPQYIIFFGKSCSGKSTYLRKSYGDYVIDVDNIFWNIFEKCFGKEKRIEIQTKSRNTIYSGQKLNELVSIYSTEDFWTTMLKFIRDNYKKTHFYSNRINFSNELFVLDFPDIGSYWHTIPAEIKGKFYLVQLETNLEKRTNFIKNRNFQKQIKILDINYKEPNYFDETRKI